MTLVKTSSRRNTRRTSFLLRRTPLFILRHSGWVATLCSLLGVVGVYFSVQLFSNLRTDFEELLPTNARAVIDLTEVRQRLLSIDSLGVLVFSKDTVNSKRFVQDLAQELQKSPKDVVASVEYRIDRELKFFKDRQALFMEASDLKTIRNYVESRIYYERELFNPLNIVREEELPEPRLNFDQIKNKYLSKAAGYERFPDGFYATPDETKRAVLVYVPGNSSGIEKSKKLRAEVDRVIELLKPKTYAADLEIRFTSGVQDALEEHAALIADLALSTVLVTLLVAGAMWIFFKNFRASFALVASLLVGTAWTFGTSYFVEGYLNANSAFLGSIVLGNGINFGIIALARYLEERRRNLTHARSTQISLSHTATATWTAALAAGLSYGSLALTDFRGFRQFGVIGLIGMVLCWLSAFVCLPAYLTLLERIKPLVKPGEKVPSNRLANACAQFVQKRSKIIILVTLLLTGLSLLSFTRMSKNILETDLSRLRNKESLEHGSAFWSKTLDEIFQRYLSPMVVLPKTREETLLIAERLRAVQKSGTTSIASVSTLDDFVPTDQIRKIELIQNIASHLPPKIIQRLDPIDQKRVSEFLTEAAQSPVSIEALPGLVLSKFTEKDGTVGKLVLVEPPLNNELWMGEKLNQFIREIRGVADAVRPGTAVAGTLAVTSDMIEAITRDGPRATAFAFAAVVVLVFLLFRDFKSSLLTLFALGIGVVWLFGIIFGFQLKINFLNFIALPITFGIGVDYGVNIFQRFKQDGNASILNTIRHTGGAVGLCSFTTVVGYASLLIASNQGFVSFGLLAVAGELTCLLAALFSLPAILIWLSSRP